MVSIFNNAVILSLISWPKGWADEGESMMFNASLFEDVEQEVLPKASCWWSEVLQEAVHGYG